MVPKSANECQPRQRSAVGPLSTEGPVCDRAPTGDLRSRRRRRHFGCPEARADRRQREIGILFPACSLFPLGHGE